MATRKYYSIRTGKNPNTRISLDTLRKLFKDFFLIFYEKEYFRESFGFYDGNSNYYSGNLGENINAQIFRILRKNDLWPIEINYADYSEDDLFDMIEFIYDYVSKPYKEGWQIVRFSKYEGQDEYREAINELLIDYENGYKLSENGEILIVGETGLTNLLEAQIPNYDPENVDDRVSKAVLKFRLAKSTVDDRKHAIRELADVLEFLREKAKVYLEEQDEKDIFNIANNFGIRHHRPNQKTKYDNAIWYSWIFYYYLATYHALVRITKRNENEGTSTT